MEHFLAYLNDNPVMWAFLLAAGFDDAIYIAIALSIASSILTAMLTKRTSSAAPPDPSTLDDFDIPQVKEGTAQEVVFGDVWLPDWQVLWYGNLATTAITTSSGGKK